MTSTQSPTPTCPHPENALDPCMVCQMRICPHCTFAASGEHFICRPCAQQYFSDNPPEDSYKQGAGGTSSILNFEKAPASMTFCLFLVLVYFISAFPIWLHAHPLYLHLTNLDVQAVIEGKQYWRLLTANLFHVDLTHLGFNAMSILIFGHLLESQVGRTFVLMCMGAALLGCDIASIAFGVPKSVGASGIAYGLQTAFIMLTAKALIVNRLQDWRLTLRSLVGYILLMGAINLMYTGQVNIYGHLGGAVAGVFCAFFYPVSRPMTRRDVLALGSLLVGLFLALVVLIN